MTSPGLRPADVCRALLAALDASDGRRRKRKRDQTADAIGLALKRTLLASKSISYAREGASGAFFTELVQRLGLADALKSKIKPTTTGEEVSGSVARGEAELGVLPVSEILPVAGVEVSSPRGPRGRGPEHP